MADARTSKMTINLGTNGTGKTTLLKRILTMSGQRALVVTPHIVEWHERTPSGADLYPLNELKQKSDYVFTGIQRHIWDPKTYTQLPPVIQKRHPSIR